MGSVSAPKPIDPATGPSLPPAAWLALVGLALVGTLATAWNLAGPVALDEVDDGYGGRIFEGDLRDRELGAAGTALVAEWIAGRTRPAWNPARILWQQLKYNAWTHGYDLALWIEPTDGNLSKRQYAIYQTGETVFLRIEFDGRNRVLDASFTPEELERALEGLLDQPGGPAEAPAGREPQGG